MIRTWKHKGLKQFFETGSASGIQAKHRARLETILAMLNSITVPEDMDLPGMRFHKLKGKLKDHYSVSVSGNWRVIFSSDGKDVILVDYLDYH